MWTLYGFTVRPNSLARFSVNPVSVILLAFEQNKISQFKERET